MLQIDQILNIIIVVSSLVLNILVLSLFSHFKVNGKLNPANWLIFIQCGIDIVFSITSFIFHAELVTINKYAVFYLINFDSVNLPVIVYYLFLWFYMAVAYINPTIVATMLYVRYQTIVNTGKAHDMKTVLKILISNCLFVVADVFMSMYNALEFDGDQNILYKFDQINNYTDTYVTKDGKALVFNVANIVYVIGIAVLVIYISSMFGVIATFLLKYRKFMIDNRSHISEETYLLNKEFFNILFLQTISPILFLLAPFCIVLVMVLFQIPARNLLTYVLISGSCVPLMNALFILLFLKKSRKILKDRGKRLVNFILCKPDQVIIMIPQSGNPTV
uniref:G_PROTEIN_RECEP_F1_2 domain-containing protein n=1 Tax=Rhabditophanes sp. KR3021 TaxID=114890 RepID=A0AC35TL89_9BILA